MARKTQKIINFHGSSVLSDASLLNKGEIAVVHGSSTNTDDVRLGIKDGKNALRWFIDSATTHAAITESTASVANKADKVTGATEDNFAGLNADGNLTDSQKSALSFSNAEHKHEQSEVANLANKLAEKSDKKHEHTHDKIVDWDDQMATKANTATTLAGYGITDAKIDGGKIILGENEIVPLTEIVEKTLSTGATTGGAKFVTGATVDDHKITFETEAIAIGNVNGLTEALAGKVEKEEGKRLITTAEGEKIEGIEAGAQVNVIEHISVNGAEISPGANKAVNVSVPSANTYVIKDLTTGEGANVEFALYMTDGTTGVESRVGASISAKDLVVNSGRIIVVDDEHKVGQLANGTYLELTIAGQATPVYINVDLLAHDYTAGDGIEISATREVSVNLLTGEKAGNVVLTESSDGLKAELDLSGYVKNTTNFLDLRLDNNIPASEVRLKLNVEDGAQVNIIEDIKLNDTVVAPDANGVVKLTGVQKFELGVHDNVSSEQSGAVIDLADPAMEVVLDLDDLDIDCGSWDDEE